MQGAMVWERGRARLPLLASWLRALAKIGDPSKAQPLTNNGHQTFREPSLPRYARFLERGISKNVEFE
jgi:hypothetical protein